MPTDLERKILGLNRYVVGLWYWARLICRKLCSVCLPDMDANAGFPEALDRLQVKRNEEKEIGGEPMCRGSMKKRRMSQAHLGCAG